MGARGRVPIIMQEGKAASMEAQGAVLSVWDAVCQADVMIGGLEEESKGFSAAAERCPLRQAGFL